MLHIVNLDQINLISISKLISPRSKRKSSPLLSRWLDSVSVCPSYSSLGYCSSSSPALPPALATHLLEHCGPVMAAFQAQVL